MFRERVIDTQVHRVTEFDSTQDFLDSDSVPAGISTIYEGNLPIDLLVSPAGSDTTIFFFHGAIDNHFTLPVLSGLGISGGVAANRVFISDPSLILDKQLLLSWYAGNYFQPNLQQQLIKIFRKITSHLGSERNVFFGGSGGGFASLFFAHHCDDSLALVFNPQTSIENYNPRAVNAFAEKAFGIEPALSTPTSQLPAQVIHNLCTLYSSPTTATVAYMQNSNDKEHMQNHLRPFQMSLHVDTKFLVLQESWDKGHTPPPKALLADLLNLTASENDWARTLSEQGFADPREYKLSTLSP